MAPDAPEPEVAALREAGADRERAFGDLFDRHRRLLKIVHTEAALPRADRLEAHFLLWEASGAASHLASARAELAFLLRHAPRGDRRATLERVDLHRRVASAR